MTDHENDDRPTPDEQFAFTQANELVRRLVEVDELSASDVGNGILIAALSCLRKAMPETDVSRLLYEYADNYATRHLDHDCAP